MPGKVAKSTPSHTMQSARRPGRPPHLASVLQERGNRANIHASSGIIWLIPVYIAEP
jgi:hypothetical protein